MSFFNIITYFIIKIKRIQKLERNLYADPIGLTGSPPSYLVFILFSLVLIRKAKPDRQLKWNAMSDQNFHSYKELEWAVCQMKLEI